jgi:acyl dehydratase
VDVKVFSDINELREAAGTHVGYSDWHEVTQRQIDQFAEATGDRQWIHVDPERAATGPFGTTIAHGYLTLSLIPMLLAQVYRVDHVAMIVNYGAERLRFPSPVPTNSRIRAGVEVLRVDEVAESYRCTVRVTVEREGGDKPVCVIDLVTVLTP